MAWVRSGDTSAMDPIVLAPAEHPAYDDRLINETYGWVMRCAAQSGAHFTDYVVSHGTAYTLAGPRLEVLVEVAVFAGYMEIVEVDGRRAYKIVDDPNFIHLKTKEEHDWEKQRQQDSSNSALTIPARFRDGDVCRYCQRVVNWDDRKGGLGGTYDHLNPGERATVDTYVVACRSCNSARRDGSTNFASPLQPAPESPIYTDRTREMFERNSWAQRNGYRLPAKLSKKAIRPGDLAPGVQPAAPIAHSQSPAPAAASSASGRPATQAENARQESRQHGAPAPEPREQRPASQAENAPKPGTTSADERPADIPQIPADTADHQGSESNVRGRDGSGRAGSGPGPVQRTGPRRTRRGRRRKPSRSTDGSTT